MDEIVSVSAVQMPWKRVADLTQLRDDLYRYLRLAKTKDAQLVVLPELVGTIIAAAMLSEQQRKRQAQTNVFNRLKRALGGSQRGALAAALPHFVTTQSDALRAAYLDLFSTAARSHGVWLVAGSVYLRDDDGQIRTLSGVFDANGDLHGWQAKLHLADHERALVVPGASLTVFEAPWGRFGVLLGNDLLYPELGRALAYRGVVGIASPAVATRSVTWKRLRIAAAARAQENQIFVVQSFLLGADELSGENGMFVGRSALSGPVELSPRGDGLLVEVGAETAEGVISGEWNIVALRRLWRDADERPRENLRGPLFAKLLGADYERGTTIAERTADIEAEAAERAARARPMILQSPAWPERRPAPAEPPPPLSAEEFLTAIEAEVEEVADVEAAREFLEAAQPPLGDELLEAPDESAASEEAVWVAGELPADTEPREVSHEPPTEEESLPAADEVSAEEEPLRAADELPAEEESLPAADELPAEEEPLRAVDEVSAEEEPLRAADEPPSDEEPLETGAEPDATRRLAPPSETPEDDERTAT